MHVKNCESMRRGFKAWCESTSAEFRSIFGLSLSEKFDPKLLANHLGIQVWSPEDVPNFPFISLKQLTVADKDSWSAVTIRDRKKTLIIVNSAHAQTRQRSSLSHEIAHLILDHTPDRIVISPKGHLLLSSFEGDQEEEADWLSATLLVPRAGLLRMYQITNDPPELAHHFEVSPDLLNWRLRITGVLTQSRRASIRRKS